MDLKSTQNRDSGRHECNKTRKTDDDDNSNSLETETAPGPRIASRWTLASQSRTSGVLRSLTFCILLRKETGGIIKIYLNKIYLQVVPGRAGGGSFRRKKWCIARKEFAYRMRARRPTSAMPKPFLCCEWAFCCSMVVMWPVLMHVMSFDVVVMSFDAMWLLVLCHVTWCNAMSCDVRSCDVPCNGRVVCSKWFCGDVVIQSTILYYKVLLCTTKHYSSTYNVLLQYYSVLQSTTPVLLCTAKYYSSTALYYKVLLQY